jgi:hypothetical protein
MKRAIFAVLGFAPFVWILLTFLSIFVFDLDEPSDPGWLTWSIFGGMGLFLAGWLIYLVDVWRNPRVPRDKRALWTALLFFAAPYVMPFYFWHYNR